jgi:hypothetical protein
MSTILKALRRLEEDRSAQSQRPLREEVTRDVAKPKSRGVLRPVLAVLLGLGVAAGAGALAFWYMGGTEEADPSVGRAKPAELAAADRASPRARPAAPAKQPRKPRAAKPARRRSSPSPAAAPSEASEQGLPAGALASKVELVKRPPAEPRIAASEAATSAGGSGTLPRPLDPEEIPGRHKLRPVRGSSAAPASSIAASTVAPDPPREATPTAGAQAGSAGPEREASRRSPSGTRPEATQPRAEPRVVTAAPEPEAPEPPATPARDAEPITTSAQAAAGKTSDQVVASAGVAPRSLEPEAPAASEVARAEIPDLRVERTVWHPTAERRFALIEFDESAERREVREGDAVGPLVVSKIEPSGVVFVHDGVELRRRVGE